MILVLECTFHLLPLVFKAHSTLECAHVRCRSLLFAEGTSINWRTFHVYEEASSNDKARILRCFMLGKPASQCSHYVLGLNTFLSLLSNMVSTSVGRFSFFRENCWFRFLRQVLRTGQNKNSHSENRLNFQNYKKIQLGSFQG